MLELRRLTGAAASTVPLVRVVATTGDGVAALADAIEVARAEVPENQRVARAANRVAQLLLGRLTAEARRALAPGGAAAALPAEVAAGTREAKSALRDLMDALRARY